MNKNLKILTCIAILFITAFSLRFYKVASAPSGILVDEASFGYNVYSLLKTGKDEHGIKTLLTFKANGDQKLPIYVYTVIPFVKLFGLNNLSVRLPSVIAGSFMGIFLFLLLLELGFKIKLSFVGSLIAVTSPWSIILSRFGYESNVALMCFIAGLFFSFFAYCKQSIFLAVFGGLCLGATWYSYIAYRFVTFFILIILIALHTIKQKRISRMGFILTISFIIAVSPFFLTLFSQTGTVRLRQTGFITNMGMVMDINENRAFCSTRVPKIICDLNSNKLISYIRIYLNRYVTALSPNYFFLNGDTEFIYLNVNNYGLFYAVLIPFYLAGLLSLGIRLITHKTTKIDLFLLAGLIFSPLPSVLAGDPQKIRLFPLFPFIILVLVYGVHFLYDLIKSKLYQKIYYGLIIVGIVVFTLFFMVNLLAVHINKHEIAYGTYIPKLMLYLNRQDKNTEIYIRSITEAIIYYSFINKTDPAIYQKKVIRTKPDNIGFAWPISLENINIANEDIYKTYCRVIENKENALYVTNEDFRSALGKAQKIIWSENNVDTLAFVYDLNSLDKSKIDCTRLQK
ncbi:hypothetical protein COY87_02940 [Candidatus Roizmanbacteria bacterium CG_4_10_14_0_8_um_filter_33_9]|uniref:Uncharacterized protein n=1 Tax=Candidatus Roizmanbacteria bacterium CG_4_10_14_0_8_um_filter_33_9 TaxID=1974826 RepID=A0A2M7QJN0_9BACT|nr:MAG: hypothetical protein COY87_02940 [Candidatus Roizmanbacteria bacterium CG_4_10_14_0_8_um_filter_33_9]